MAAFGDEQVRGLDVPMHNTCRVCRIEGVRDLDGEREDLLDLHGTSADPVLQGHAIQILHGDERLPMILVNLVNRADVRMIESRRGLRLALKARQCLRVFGDLIRQKLQGHKAM